MATLVPKYTLSSGYKIPTLGLGTWQSKPGEVGAAVKAALACGYHLIDCAFVYGNEVEVGQAIEDSIRAGVVTRQELFIISKVWNTYHSTDKVKDCIKKSIENLKTSYLDMCLIHWPMGYQEGGENFPKDDTGEFIFSDVDYLDTWKGLENAVKDGLVRSIGLSNFNSEQIQRIIDHADIKPSLLEVELHPYYNQSPLVEFCRNRDILVCAYSPFGSPNRPWATGQEPKIIDDPKIKTIGDTHDKTSAQVILRWLNQRGIIAIPKSVTVSRLEENIKVHDFSLSDDEMEIMNSLQKNIRHFTLDWVSSHKYWPFRIPF